MSGIWNTIRGLAGFSTKQEQQRASTSKDAVSSKLAAKDAGSNRESEDSDIVPIQTANSNNNNACVSPPTSASLQRLIVLQNLVTKAVTLQIGPV